MQSQALCGRASLALIALASLLAAGSAAAAGYAVVPGSADNELVLQLAPVRAGGPMAVTAELVAAPDWLESPAITIEAGPPQAIVLRFAVSAEAAVGARSAASIRLEWRSESGDDSSALVRHVALQVAARAPAEQRSFRVEECCLPTTGVEHDGAGRPLTHVLLGNTPNPWRSLTSVRFGLPAGVTGIVTLRVHDVLGRRVATMRTPPLAGGYHQINWEGRDDTGVLVPSGLYFYELSTAEWRGAGKMIILR